MGQALYRKYRSKSLSDIVGQEHIVTTLQNALKKGSISHAYLLTGPRGTGKTSIARILAHEINELPYNEEPHIDIIEIDAASNRRIDEIRDLRDKIHIAPSSAKYKVYIIDEVHMLTKEAFNALLKTLEEPPAHVIFILATTEIQKLPETIVSRTQRYTFKPADPAKAVAHMRNIAKKEGITISDEALALVAQRGDGSFRDSLSLLDQVSSLHKDISADDVREMLGIAPQEVIEALYQQTISGTPKELVNGLVSLQDQGYEAVHVAKQLAQVVRNDLLEGNPTNGQQLTSLLQQLIEVPTSNDPQARLEVVLLGVNLVHTPDVVAAKTHMPKPVTVSEPVKRAEKPVIKPDVEAPVAVEPEPEPEEEPIVPPSPVEPTDDFVQAWNNTLQEIKKTNNTLYGVLRMAEPAINDTEVTLSFKFPFHQKKVNETKNTQLIGKILGEQLGKNLTVKSAVNKNAKPVTETPVAVELPPAVPVSNEPAPLLDTISNIFGTAEVLES